jgi:hypothetical protein
LRSIKTRKGERRQYPSTSFIVACHDKLLLLDSKGEGLEMWLLTLKDAGVEAVLDERV